MKKILSIVIFFLFLLPMTPRFVHTSSSSAVAQKYGNENKCYDDDAQEWYYSSLPCDAEPGTSKCRACGQQMLISEEKAHKLVCPGSPDGYTCSWCDKHFTSNDEYAQHQMTCGSNPSDQSGAGSNSGSDSVSGFGENSNGINSLDGSDGYYTGGTNGNTAVYYFIVSGSSGKSKDDDTYKVTMDGAKGYSGKIKSILVGLEKNKKIFFVDSIACAQYDPNKKCLNLKSDTTTTVSGILHEVVHAVQDNLGMLDYDHHSSENEYQAYAMNYILEMAKNNGNDAFATRPVGVGKNDWKKLYNSIKANCGYKNGGLYYNQQFLDDLNDSKFHEDMSGIFRNYSETYHYPSAYWKNSDVKHYNWNWENLLNSLGFEKKKK